MAALAVAGIVHWATHDPNHFEALRPGAAIQPLDRMGK
jgi:hypothetical protein